MKGRRIQAMKAKQKPLVVLAGIALVLTVMTLMTIRAVAMSAPESPFSARPVTSTLPGEDVPIMPSIRHIAYLGAAHEPYNSTPPTSGPHVPWTIAPGIYREEIPEELQVHALEHGHVLVQYAPGTPPEQVRILETIGKQRPRDVIVAPNGKLRSGIALTAWGRIELLEQADQYKIMLFVVELSGRYDHGWKRDAPEPEGFGFCCR